MVAGSFKVWWSKLGPYYSKAYQEVWPGFLITAYFYYQISYGGKKAVKDKPAH